MSEENKISRGVIVEFDFTAVDGAQILFDTAKKQLADIDVKLDVKTEALHLTGGNYQGGLAELFEANGKRNDPAKAAGALAEAFAEAVAAKYADAVTNGFKAFVRALTDKGVKVVVATRGDVDALTAALGDLVGDSVVVYRESSLTYGNCKWDAWRRACGANGLREFFTAAVTGSGAGVKSALVAGLSAAAVVHPHVEWQDFGGADAVTEKFDAAFAGEVLRMLHLS